MGRGGMQHRIFMIISEHNYGFNNDQEQLLTQCNPGISIQAGYYGPTKSQGGTLTIIESTSFITSINRKVTI